MQLQLTLASDRFYLPLNYRYLIHGMIYQALSSDPWLSSVMHGTSGNDQRVKYKGFTFSQLMGQYSVQDHIICFASEAKLEIRCLSPMTMMVLASYFSDAREIRLGDVYAEITDMQLKDEKLLKETAHIQMMSPAVVYKTESPGKTFFYSPMEETFYTGLLMNAKRKTEAFFPDASFSLSIKLAEGNVPQKQFSMFRRTYINGWLAEFILQGEPQVLNILYQMGLGAKNTEGYGMFRVLKS